MRLLMATALLALISAIPVGAQEDASQAVTWSWRLATPDARPGEEAELILEARIAPHWVVYSSDFEAALGPRPARLSEGFSHPVISRVVTLLPRARPEPST